MNWTLKTILDPKDIGNIETGEYAAQVFKYYSQYNVETIDVIVDLKRIQSKTLFESNRKIFNHLVEVFQKYQIVDKLAEYLHFCVIDKHLGRFSVNRILDRQMLVDFFEKLQIREQRAKIYSEIVESAENLARECIEHCYPRVVDYIKDLILQRKLAAYYVTGKVSKYYLAAIPKFPKIVSKMDVISKGEFEPLVSKYEKLSINVQEAMIQENVETFKIFDFTDDKINELKSLNVVQYQCIQKV